MKIGHSHQHSLYRYPAQHHYHKRMIQILSSSKELGQRLPWNIGLLLRKLWVVVCFQSRRLAICKHFVSGKFHWRFAQRLAVNKPCLQIVIALIFVNMVCLPLIAEQNANEICLTQECLQIVRRLLWKQTTTCSLRNNNPMFHGNLWPNSFEEPSILISNVPMDSK